MTGKAGVIGLGRMGNIFAGRLLDHGLLESVWNRTTEKAAVFAERGAKMCTAPAGVVADCEVTLVSMASEAALEEVFDGPDGILSASLKGRTIVETSTVRPSFIRRLSDRVIAAGGVLIDAPILGTVGPAREGRVVIVAGGPAEVVDRVRPMLAAISRKVVHMGPIGAGALTKLTVNMHLATYWYSLAESIAMGRRGGLDLEAILHVLTDSPVATSALAGKLPSLLGHAIEIGFDISGVVKDLTASLDLARVTGVTAAAASAALAGFARAVDEGYGESDVAAIVHAVFNRPLPGSKH
jgi:3-hydroxyisobutyrate dehydrogenase